MVTILCWFCLIVVTALCEVKILGFVMQEDADTRLAIQEALSMMVGAYSNLEGAQRTLMEALVASYLIKVFSVESKLSTLQKVLLIVFLFADTFCCILLEQVCLFLLNGRMEGVGGGGRRCSDEIF